jgi:hypothetical protein
LWHWVQFPRPSRWAWASESFPGESTCAEACVGQSTRKKDPAATGRLLKNPDISEQDRHRHVNPEDEEHHDGQREVEDVPIAEESLEWV